MQPKCNRGRAGITLVGFTASHAPFVRSGGMGSAAHDPARDVLTNAELAGISAGAFRQFRLLNSSRLAVFLGKNGNPN